jgi:hypothetical protein
MAPDAPGPFRCLKIVIVVLQVAEVRFVRHGTRVQPAVLESKRPTLQTCKMTGAKPASSSAVMVAGGLFLYLLWPVFENRKSAEKKKTT